MLTDEDRFIVELAGKARARAYAPYSGFKVGAAILWQGDGKENYSVGANVENASYGATICAERSAVCSWVGARGSGKIVGIAVVAEYIPLPGGGVQRVKPCGMCLQVLSEFVLPASRVVLADPSLAAEVWQFEQLFPQPFHLLEGNRKKHQQD